MLIDGELESRLENLEAKVDINHQTLSIQIKQGLDTAHYARIKNVKDLKESIKHLDSRVEKIERDVEVLKEDVKILKDDVRGLKEDVKVLKDDVSGLKEDVKGLQISQNRMENTMFEMFEYMKKRDEKIDKVVEHLQNTLK